MITFFIILFAIIALFSGISGAAFLAEFFDSIELGDIKGIISNILLCILLLAITYCIGAFIITPLQDKKEQIPNCLHYKEELENKIMDSDVFKTQIHEDFIVIYKLLNIDKSTEDLHLDFFNDNTLKYHKHFLEKYIIENDIELTSRQKNIIERLHSDIENYYSNLKDIKFTQYQIDKYQESIIVKHYCN